MLPTPPGSPVLGACRPVDRLGLRLANRLELESVIGIGAYGVVYRAIDVETHQFYAVKALSKVGMDHKQRKFQQREIELHHKASRHPNIVTLESVMDAPDCTYVILEYCPEGDLFASITENGFYAGKDELVREAFVQVLDAVQHCHDLGIFHRDLKPENILVTDGGRAVKLADFGLATRDRITTDFGCGSTFYMSPECQSTGGPSSSYLSAPNDVWSLGVILVNLACGRNPWKRASYSDATFRAFLRDPHFLSSILPISSELERILGYVFQPDPMHRISLCQLKNLVLRCSRFTVPAPRVSPSTPPPSPPADGQASMYCVHGAYQTVHVGGTRPLTPPAEVGQMVFGAGPSIECGFSGTSSVSSSNAGSIPCDVHHIHGAGLGTNFSKHCMTPLPGSINNPSFGTSVVSPSIGY